MVLRAMVKGYFTQIIEQIAFLEKPIFEWESLGKGKKDKRRKRKRRWGEERKEHFNRGIRQISLAAHVTTQGQEYGGKTG